MPASGGPACEPAGARRTGLPSATLGRQDTAGDLAPGDELDLLLAEGGAEGVAGEEVEVALAPGGPPGLDAGVLRARLGVVVADVRLEEVDAGRELAEGLEVVGGPLVGRDGRRDSDLAVDDHIVGADRAGER